MAATEPIVDATPEPEEGPVDGSPEASHEHSDAVHGAGGCPVTWCPICITVGAVQPVAPDVMEHLLKAGTELFLAFRAIVDARADDATGTPSEDPGKRPTIEKIDLG